MTTARGPSLASPLSPAGKPEGAARPRKKLQKGGARQRTLAKRPEISTPTQEERRQHKEHKEYKEEEAVVRRRLPSQAQPAQQASLPLPPDLSDSKWLEYIRGSGLLCASLNQSPALLSSKERHDAPRSIVPEFSHLALSSRGGSQDSLEKLSSTESSRSSDASRVRRRAKTPVLKIGQLEGNTVLPAQDIELETHAVNKTSSVELIAEQYRALLQSRSSMLFDSRSEPPPSRQEGRDEAGDDIRRGSSEEPGTTRVPSTTTVPATAHLAVQPPNLLTGSPTSDDGTLVSFEEETVYFKPVSFSPEPPSPIFHDHDPLPALSHLLPSPAPHHNSGSNSDSDNNLSLQICLDLLVRELSSSLLDRPHQRRGAADASSLQIWVMIEAYERLRDQVCGAHGDGAGQLRPEEAQPLEAMFDTWLRALYCIHDRLAGGEAGESGSDGSDYEALESEDAD
ncbi:hypothetical protein NKR23_g3298 [Pleurostoma richardsiae]|uniref:Uncharacterized protein n=1 Tax=Pleurostoma richardsiae TaxID=41990 RepID=A0AA38VM92_9PEZI|nr:hypothetical protein NKR23_g3298 [Pleurostoma richardsiae]